MEKWVHAVSGQNKYEYRFYIYIMRVRNNKADDSSNTRTYVLVYKRNGDLSYWNSISCYYGFTYSIILFFVTQPIGVDIPDSYFELTDETHDHEHVCRNLNTWGGYRITFESA